jgi:sugar phosphate isomerase/epimerase
MVRQSPSVGYSLNVFPDETLAELWTTLRTHAVRIRREAFGNRPFPVELRLSAQMAAELRAKPQAVIELRDYLRGEGLRLVTLNAFVPVSFHQPNLKARVYLPAWHESDERIRYTCDCADLLTELAPAEVAEPSLSVPGGVLKRDFADAPGIHRQTADALRRCAEHCAAMEKRTGRRIVIAIEPEPGLTYERTDEVIAFFAKFFPTPESRRHLGVNFDICHQLVEFEDPAASVAALEKAGVRITKIHVSNCIEIAKPLVAPELMEALRRGYAESKFLHQTAGADKTGRVVYFSLDLPEALTPDGLRAMAHAGVETLRIHYHMPLLPGGVMPTTLSAVESFVRGLALSHPDVPLIIETYTWLEHLPAAGGKRQDLPANIAAEIAHVRGWL